MKADGDSFRAFLGWCVAGAAGCFGVLSLPSVGPFVLLGTLPLCGWLLSVFTVGRAMGGLLAGAAAPVLYVAWLNRAGPGEVCTSTATSRIAAGLAAFPQPCLRNDRTSVLDQQGRSDAEAIARELEHGLRSLASGAGQGAARFSGGEGRHGAF